MIRPIAAERPERYGVGASTVRDVLVTVLTWPSGAPSRKQVAAHLDVSSTTISKAVAYLIENGFILQDAEREAGRPGRREAPLRVHSERCHLAGVSVREPRGEGPGELFGVVVDLSGDVVFVEKGIFEGSTPREVITAVAELTDRLLGPYDDAVGFGVAIGGQIAATEGAVTHSWNFQPPWEDVQLAKRLYEITELHVEVENDANALTLYEQWFGSGRGHNNFAVARVTPDGIGFGLVAEGRLLRGEDGISGELGHTEIDSRIDAPMCRCEKQGCLEIFLRLATDALKEHHDSGESVEAVRFAGDAMGRVLAQLQLTTASGCLIVCGETLVHNREFQEAVCTAFERRPFVGSARRLIEWKHTSEQQVAQGAATALLRHLPFVMFPRM